MALDLSHFKLTQATLEIRYANAYVLWDRSGLVWSLAGSKWAKLRVVKAEPMVTTFIAEDRYELSVNLDKAHIIDLKPTSSLQDFIANSEIFVPLVMSSLDITEFSRLGFRLIYKKKCSDKASAAESLVSTNLMKVPTGKHFSIEGAVLMPQYSLRWEGASSGVKVSLSAQNTKIDLDVTPGVDEISPVHIDKSELIYDVDYYTLQSTSKGQLNVKEWISQAYHLIKRDSKVFFGA